MPTPDFKRVLILSEDIPETKYAGGILLWRLFAAYGEGKKLKCGKAERLKEGSCGRRHTADGGRQTADGLGNRGQGTGDREEPKLFVIGPRAHPEAEVLDCPYRELRMPLARLDNTRLSMHKRSLSALGLIPLPSHGRVLGLLGGFDPQVIVCVMVNTPWMLLAERTARRLGVPLVLIVHDLNEEFEQVFPWARRALFEKNRQVYRAAARRLCVSPAMAKFLEDRYGVPGEVMYPNRGEELQPRPLAMSLTLRTDGEKLKN